MANEIDTLMDLDPMQMSDKDLDAIIQYHRNNRANSEAGIKPKKESGPKQSLDLAKLGLIKKPATVAPTARRRTT